MNGTPIPNGNGSPLTIPETARWLLGRGLAPIPLQARLKKPAISDWRNLRLTDGDIDRLFDPDGNIGVLLGHPSGGLIDIDLDSPEAILAAEILLPPTDMISGRRSARRSHWWYFVDNAPTKAAEVFDGVTPSEAAEGRRLVELRSSGGQTMLPPSLHPSGERCDWHAHGEPARTSIEVLRTAVRRVAAAALLGRHWPRGARHDASLALAGALLRAGWQGEMVERFLRAVCGAAEDSEVEDRARAIRDTDERLRQGDKTTGWPTLARLLGACGGSVVATVQRWLGVHPQPPQATGLGSSKPSSSPRYTPRPPWRPFPVEYLPAPIRDFTLTVSAAMLCDPTFVALPALAASAGMIGATRTIRLKYSWHEPAMIWAVVVGESGTLKSPPYKLAMRPVLTMQAAHIKAKGEAMETYRAEVREYERDKRKNKDHDPGDPPVEPTCVSIYTRDTTIEALAVTLADNRVRFLVGRDELSGWLASFNQYKAKGGSDQANWLELHSLGTLAVDRKTGDPKKIFVQGVGVSIAGGIQPGVLRAALSPEHFSAGIPARLLFAYPPRRDKDWTEDDIDEAVEQVYHQLIRALADLQPHTNNDGDPYPIALSLTPEAKAEWITFYRRFAHRQAETEGDLAAAFSKLEGYAARLSLLHYVCQSVHDGEKALGPIGLADIRAGIALAEWFTYEAERVYQMLAESRDEREVRELYDLVVRLSKRPGKNGRVSPRELQNHNSRKYNSDSAKADLERLVGFGLGVWEQDDPKPGKGGPQAEYFRPFQTPDTSDTSYTCPDDGWPDLGGDDGDSSDTCSDTRPPTKPGPSSTGGITGTNPMPYGKTPQVEPEQVSEVSDVGADRPGGSSSVGTSEQATSGCCTVRVRGG